MSGSDSQDTCEFVTERLQVGSWHAAAHRNGRNLAEVVAEMLTVRTTMALPESWRGEYDIERANAWIEDRDAESPTLLVIESSSERPIGLLILAEDPLDASTVDLRIGYVIAETWWGQGFATELLSGLVDWARSQSTINTLTGGVELSNQASVRVLEKRGFTRINEEHDGTATYQIDTRQPVATSRITDGALTRSIRSAFSLENYE